MDFADKVAAGECSLGIEFGSTRVKAVLIAPDFSVVATGDHEWENHLVDGVWTYSMDEVKTALQDAYAHLAASVASKYGVKLAKLKAFGISAMMHGYLPFDGEMRQLAAFRTWRNTITARAAGILSDAFDFNIPQRWSIAHLYEAILNSETHVGEIRHLTTLAGYVHYLLTGRKVLGVGEASGMFPIDSATLGYNAKMLETFDSLVAEKGYSWRLGDILPEVLVSGDDAGRLTEAGARLLDPSGALESGAKAAPPEGDAGTGMVATNAVAAATGNISAGTSVFAMVVLEKPLSRRYEEIDMVTTPSGKAVAMVHCNNCTNEINAWVKLFGEASALLGGSTEPGDLYGKLFGVADEGEADCGGVVVVNYLSGESVTGLDDGRPMTVRRPDAKFSLANVMRANLYSAIATLAIGMETLTVREKVAIERITGHGGYFKRAIGGKFMAGALNVPVTCLATANEGGAWGMAILAAFAAEGDGKGTLEEYLDKRVFAAMEKVVYEPEADVAEGFKKYLDAFKTALPAERVCSLQFAVCS